MPGSRSLASRAHWTEPPRGPARCMQEPDVRREVAPERLEVGDRAGTPRSSRSARVALIAASQTSFQRWNEQWRGIGTSGCRRFRRSPVSENSRASSSIRCTLPESGTIRLGLGNEARQERAHLLAAVFHGRQHSRPPFGVLDALRTHEAHHVLEPAVVPENAAHQMPFAARDVVLERQRVGCDDDLFDVEHLFAVVYARSSSAAPGSGCRT